MTVVEAIPYRTFKEKVSIVKKKEKEGSRIEITPNYIYIEKYFSKEDYNEKS